NLHRRRRPSRVARTRDRATSARAHGGDGGSAARSTPGAPRVASRGATPIGASGAQRPSARGNGRYAGAQRPWSTAGRVPRCDARDREINFILTDRDRGKVQAIEDALERVEDGSYGMCESCEAEIAEGRLQAMPFTRLCVQCQADREIEAKQNRRGEDDRAYR